MLPVDLPQLSINRGCVLCQKKIQIFLGSKGEKLRSSISSAVLTRLRVDRSYWRLETPSGLLPPAFFLLNMPIKGKVQTATTYETLFRLPY
jgi:hypothetical protein